MRESLARLHVHVRLFRLQYRARVRTQALEEHAAVVEAIASRDPDVSRAAMREHIERSAQRFRGILDTLEA